MREIMTIQVGNAGNRIAEDFWNLIAHEHDVSTFDGNVRTNNYLQLQRIEVFFNRTRSSSYYARAISVDTDPSCHDCSNFLYNPKNIIEGKKSAGNNFAYGYLTGGAALLENTIEVVRKECEHAEALQGFQFMHSIGGGTGSGLTSLLLETLSEYFPDNLMANYVVFPSIYASQVITEPYNAVLAMPYLIEHSHLTYCIDNEALYHIFKHRLHETAETESDVNHLIALVISGITACMRFPGQLNSGLRKIFVNMVPYPSMHFLITGFSPLNNCQHQKYLAGTVTEIVQDLFSSNNLLCAIELTDGKLLTAAALFRGLMSTRCVEDLVYAARNQNPKYFADWIPNNIKTSICDIPPKGLQLCSTFLGNTTAITSVFARIYNQASAMYQKKAHLHWYLGEGLEESELVDALESVKNLINSYEDSIQGSE